MAEIAGISLTIPAILNGAWTILRGAYDLYGGVDNRKEEVKILLERTRGLIEKIAENLQSHPNASPLLSTALQTLEITCAAVKSVVETLSQKGFLWILMHPDNIDREIHGAEAKVDDAFKLFNLAAHLNTVSLTAEVAKARENDRTALSIQLKSLASSDVTILQAIRDANGVQRRMEEVLIAIYKHVETLPRSQDATPEEAFLRSAATSIQRASNHRSAPVFAFWVVSSLEVEFHQDDLIGEGSFGRIFKGEWNGAVVAVKQMYRQDASILTTQDRKVIENEVRIWSQLQHPNVLSLFGACPEAQYPFLLMRLCQHGNVLQYLKKYPDVKRSDLSYGITAGLSFLHSKRIIHADLKGVNVLVSDDHRALLTDFGLSLMLDDVRSRSTTTQAGPSRGTLRWMAPECLNGHRANEASDVYSLGMTIWEVYSEELPLATFPERVIAFQIETKQLRPERPQRLVEDTIWESIQLCWTHDATQRPKVEAVRHALKSYTSYARPEESASPPLASFFSESPWGSSETNVDLAFENKPTVRRRGEDTISSAWTARPEPGQRTATNISKSLQTVAQPWSQTEWSDSLYSNPPKWQRGNPDVYIDSIIFPVVPSNKTYQYRVIKGSEDLGIQPTYTLNKDGSQTVNLLEYNGGYGIQETIPIQVIAVDPEGHEVLVATSRWAHSLRSEPPRWRHGDSNHSIESVMFPRIPTQKSYSFRVVKGKEDLGVKPSPTLDDGTFTIDLVDYNGGQGIQESTSIRVFAVDSERNEELIATWDVTTGTTSTAVGSATESAWRSLSPHSPERSQQPIPRQRVGLSSRLSNPSESPWQSPRHPSPEVATEERQSPDPSTRNPKRQGWRKFFKA